MPDENHATLDFLASRQSVPLKAMGQAVPDRAELMAILSIAIRVPDHGSLAPWRLIVLDRAAMARLADQADARARTLHYDAEKRAKGRKQYDLGCLAVAVISSPKPVERIPLAEQRLSAGALCMNIVHAATAFGWGACWLTGWPTHDNAFCQTAFDCMGDEVVAGIFHIGGRPVTAMADRPRPDLARILSWPE